MAVSYVASHPNFNLLTNPGAAGAYPLATTAAKVAGKLYRSTGTHEVTTTTFANTGDVLVLVDLSSSIVPREISLGWDDLGGTLTADLGLLETRPPKNAVDDDLFATALDLAVASGMSDRMNEASNFDLDDEGKALWELVNAVTAGTYDVDPGETWHLALTALATPSGVTAGTISWDITYSRV